MISLKYEKNNRCYNDLVMLYPGGKYRFDSHYFAISSRRPKAKANVKAVICDLLCEWMKVLNTVQDGDIVYLVFSLEDQGSGWIQCIVDGGQVLFETGTSSIEGYQIDLSNISEMAKLPTDFQKMEDSEPTITTIEKFFDSIKQNIKECQ